MDKNWLWRDVPRGFYDNAGHHTAKKNSRLYQNIPDEHKKLACIIIEAAGKCTVPPLNTCVGFRSFLYMLYKDLQKDGSDLELPYYWFADGVMIEPELIVRATNGIVGFVCDDSIEHCGRAGECVFSSKKPVVGMQINSF